MNNELQKVLQQWQLSNILPFTHCAMTNNYVVIVYSDQYKKDVVLKVGPKSVIDREIQALQYFQSDACVKLLQFDQEYPDENSALLLEYVHPGNSLKDLFLQRKEEKTIEIFADVIKKLHLNSHKKLDQELSSKVQTTEQRMNLLHTFQSKNEDLIALLPQAAKLADKLIASQGKQYLLHGDLHHENILQCGDAWVMIDPQGVVGELEFEVGAFIRNPVFTLLEQNNVESLLLYRFERLSQLLNLDKQRIIDWSFVQAVLSACYYEDDCQDEQDEKAFDYWIKLAQLIAKISY